jgi:hypothetical protein
VDFEAEPTEEDVMVMLRSDEWDYVPTCADCHAALDVRVLSDEGDDVEGLGELFG